MSNTNTSLHLAVQNGNIDIVKMLLDAGNDLNAVNTDDLTPLQLAIQAGHTDIAALIAERIKENNNTAVPLRRNGKKEYAWESKDIHGVTPLENANERSGLREILIFIVLLYATLKLHGIL